MRLTLLAGSSFMLNDQLLVDGINASLTSEGEGAVLEAQQLARHFKVINAGRLEIHRVHLRNGKSKGPGGTGGPPVKIHFAPRVLPVRAFIVAA